MTASAKHQASPDNPPKGGDAAQGDSPKNSDAPKGLVPALVFIGMVVAILSSLGAPLVPDLAKQDHVSLITAQWTLTIAFLASAMATPTMGRIGDGPGRRKMIIGGLAVVTVGCVLAALPLGFSALLCGRFMQGIGLGLTPLTIATARDSLPKDKATSAVAMLSLTTVVGVGLGYPLTGFIVEVAGLAAAFWFGAAMSAVALVIGFFVVPQPKATKRIGRDVAGAILLAAALACLLLATSEGPVWGWGSPAILVFFAAAIALIVGWVFAELHADHPLVNVTLLRLRPVQTADVTALLAGIGMYLLISLITRFMQTPKSSGYGLGSNVLVSGLVLVPFSVFSLLASRVATMMQKYMSPGKVLTVACAPMMLALLLFAYGRGGGLWMLFVVMGVAGLGIGCIFDVMPQLIVNAVPSAETGSAISFNQVARLVGYATGSALSAIVLQMATGSGSPLPKDSGYTTAGVCGAVLWVVTAVAAFFLPGRSAGKAPAHAAKANSDERKSEADGTKASSAKADTDEQHPGAKAGASAEAPADSGADIDGGNTSTEADADSAAIRDLRSHDSRESAHAGADQN